MTIDNSDLKMIVPKRKALQKDVSISVNSQAKRISFTFRNELYELIAPEDYVAMGFKKNRLYFIPVEIGGGYKITNKLNGKGYFQISDPAAYHELSAFEGTFEMHFNEDRDLYYIEKTEG